MSPLPQCHPPVDIWSWFQTQLPRCHPPVEIWSWFQTQVHQVLIHLLVQSTSPGSDSSSTCWHLCWQPPWPWRGGSSGSGSPPNSSFSLLTINTADEKAALSWPDLAWEVAGRMQSHPVLDPSSFRRSSCTNSQLSTSTRGRSYRHPLPVARKTAFNLENWSSSAGKQQHSFVVLLILIERMIYGLQHN